MTVKINSGGKWNVNNSLMQAWIIYMFCIPFTLFLSFYAYGNVTSVFYFLLWT
jgi:hypothetical protein